MADNKKNEEDQMNRRSLITLASVVSLAVWHKPIINSVVLPAHAQTSCANPLNIDVLGKWLFTDVNGKQIQIEFINDQELKVKDTLIYGWSRLDDGKLQLDVRGPAKGWTAFISMEENCIASKITVTDAPGDETEFIEGPFTEPVIGSREN